MPNVAHDFYTHSIILLGAQHVGKSIVGKKLAHRLQQLFFDTDALILAHYPQYDSIRTLYNDKGQDEFYMLEYQQLDHICKSNAMPCIIATGGGIAQNMRALEIVQQFFIKILLASTPDIVWERIIPQGIPAYLSTPLSAMPIDTLSQNDIEEMKQKFIPLFTKKQSIYESIANHNIAISIKTSTASIEKTTDDIVNEIIAHIETHQATL